MIPVAKSITRKTICAVRHTAFTRYSNHLSRKFGSTLRGPSHSDFKNGYSLTIFDDGEQFESFSIQPEGVFI